MPEFFILTKSNIKIVPRILPRYYFFVSAYNDMEGGVTMTDRKRTQYKNCQAVIGTLTGAQKAQKALAAAAIPSAVSKSESASQHRGCVWSVSFSCNQEENVRAVLSSAGIKVKSFGGNDDIF